MAEEVSELIARLKLVDETVAGLNASRTRFDKVVEAAEKAENQVKQTGVAFETTDVKVRQAGKSIDAVERSISGVATTASLSNRVLKEHADAIEKIRLNGVRMGLSQTEIAEQIRRADALRDQGLQRARDAGAKVEAQFASTTVATNNLAASTANAANQHRLMAFQIQDVVSSLGSSAPPMQVLLQQGPQLIAIYGGVGAAAKAVANVLGGPYVLGAAAAAATLGVLMARSSALTAEQRTFSVALAAVGKQAETSSIQLAAYARQLEKVGVSRADSQAAVATLARNPQLDAQRSGQIVSMAADLGAALGIEATEAMKRLAEAATGTYADLVKLDEQMKLFDTSTRNNIRTLMEQGKATQAVDLAFKILGDRVKGLHEEQMSPMDKTLKDLANSWTSFMDRIASSGPVLAAVKLLAEAVAGLDDMARRAGGPAQRPGDAQENDIASLVMRRDKMMERLNGLDPSRPANQMILNAIRDDIGRTNLRITELERSRDAAQGRANPATGMGLPLPDSSPAPGVVSPDNMATQWSKMEDLTASWRRQNEVLKASIPTRVAIEARLAAENELLSNGLKGQAAIEFVRRRVEEATKREADARGQEAASMDRATRAQLNYMNAAERGLGAMYAAKAAAEANEQATTKSAVAESALAQAILKRDAAQEAAKMSDVLQSSNANIKQLQELIAAHDQGPGAAYWAETDAKIKESTRSLRAYASVVTDPALRAVLEALADRVEQRKLKEQELNDVLELRKKITNGNQELEYLQKQLELIGKSAGERERELSVLKAIQEIESKGGNRNNLSQDQVNYIDQRRKIAEANSELRKQQTLYDEIANSAVRAFDQVGDAITQAFVQGNGAAVNWGNVMRGIMSSVLQQIMKLAVINPILNSVLGGERASIWSAGGSAAAGASQSGGFSLSNLLNVGGMAKGFFGGGFSGGAPSGISNFLFGQSAVGQLGPQIPTSGLFGSGGIENVLGPGLSSMIPGIGSIGGMFAGFGMGSALGSIFAKSQAQRTNSMIGAALGSLLLGPLGGIIGGIGGSFIGPRDSVQGYGLRLQSAGRGPDNTDINDYAGSLLPVSRQYYNESGAAVFQQADDEVARTNAYLAERNLQVRGVSIIGGNKNGPDYSWADAGSIAEGYSRLNFRSTNNDNLSAALNSRTFGGVDKLREFVDEFISVQDTIKSMTADAIPAFTQSLNAVNKTFDDTEASARRLGVAETGMAAARAKALAELAANRDETVRQSAVSLTIRRLTADGNTQQAALARQTEEAAIEMRNFTKSLDEMVVAAERRSELLVQLEETQAAERAAIVRQYAEQANQALQQRLDQLTGAAKNIRQYLDSLNASSATGVSAEQRVLDAKTIFLRDRDLAAGGDIDAANRVTASADAYLTAARESYASAEGYQIAFNTVKAALESIPAVVAVDNSMEASLAAIRETTLAFNDTAITLLNVTTGSSALTIQWLSNIYSSLGVIASNDVGHTGVLLGGIDVNNHLTHAGTQANLAALSAVVYAIDASNQLAFSFGTAHDVVLRALNDNVLAVGNAQNSALGVIASNAVAVGSATNQQIYAMHESIVAIGAVHSNALGIIASNAGNGNAATNELLHAVSVNVVAVGNAQMTGIAGLATNQVNIGNAHMTGLAGIATNQINIGNVANTISAGQVQKLADLGSALQTVVERIVDVNSSIGFTSSRVIDVNSSIGFAVNRIVDINTSLSTINGTIGTKGDNTFAAIGSLSTNVVNIAAANTTSFNSINTNMVNLGNATNTTLGYINSYVSFMDNTLKAISNYNIEVKTNTANIKNSITLQSNMQATAFNTMIDKLADVVRLLESIDRTLKLKAQAA